MLILNYDYYEQEAARLHHVAQVAMSMMRSKSVRAKKTGWNGWVRYATARRERWVLYARGHAFYRRRVCTSVLAAWASCRQDSLRRVDLLTRRVRAVELCAVRHHWRRFVTASRRSEKTPAVLRKMALRAVEAKRNAALARCLHFWHASVSNKVSCRPLVKKLRERRRGDRMRFFFRRWSDAQRWAVALRRGARSVLRFYVAKSVRTPMRAALQAWRVNGLHLSMRNQTVARAVDIFSRFVLRRTLRHMHEATLEKASEVTAWRVVMKWKNELASTKLEGIYLFHWIV